MVIIEKSPKLMLEKEKYKVFEYSKDGCEKAKAWAKENGYNPMFFGYELEAKVGMCYVDMYGDVCVKIMNQEIEG